jgi:hypothetical protein
MTIEYPLLNVILDIMDSGKGYVIDGNAATPLLLDGSLKYPDDAPRSYIQKQQDPWVLVIASLSLSLTGYYIILKTLGAL